MKKFAGIGVTGNSEAGLALDLTFLGSPSGLTLNKDGGSLYLADAKNEDVRYFRNPVESGEADWTSERIFSGIVNISEADRKRAFVLGKIGGIVWDSNGDVFWTDFERGHIVRARGSELSLVANVGGERGMSGDCGPSTLAAFRYPRGITIVPNHGVFKKSLVVADSGNNRVRAIEITEWPYCLASVTDVCDATEFINRNTGKLCSDLENISSCAFPTDSPDLCAHTCKYFGSGLFPTRLPRIDYFLNQSLVELLFNRSNGYLDIESASLVPESYKTMRYVLLKDFAVPTSGGDTEILRKGDARVMGINWYGSVRSLNATEAENPDFIMRFGSPQEGMTGGIVSLRFEVAGQECKRWAWVETKSSHTTVVRSGHCYMMPTEGTSASGACVLENATAVGDRNCTPGRIRTIIGSGSPGVGETPGRAFSFTQLSNEDLEALLPPLKVSLKSPRGVHFYKRDILSPFGFLDPRPSLLLTDTFHRRILGMPLNFQVRYVVRAWIFFAGADAKKVAQDESKFNAIAKTLNSLNGVKGDFFEAVRPLNGNFTGTDEAASSQCDPIGFMLDSQQRARDDLESRLNQVCEINFCTEGSTGTFLGLSSQACCIAACASCLQNCVSAFALYEASTSSSWLCSGQTIYRNCLADKGKCTPPSEFQNYTESCTVNASLDGDFLKALQVGVRPLRAEMLTTYCPDLPPDSEREPCKGCDTRAYAVLGGNASYLSLNSSAADDVIGVLMGIEVADQVTQMNIAAFFSKLVLQQNLAMKTGYPSSDSTNEELAALREFLDALQDEFKHAFGFNPSLRIAVSSTEDVFQSLLESFASTAYRSPSEVYELVKVEDTTFEVVDEHTAKMEAPVGLTQDRYGRLYFTDLRTQRILRVDDVWKPDPSVEDVLRIAGTGYATFTSDGKLANASALNQPLDVESAADGVLFVADSQNHQVTQIVGLTNNALLPGSVTWPSIISNPTAEQLSEIQNNITCRSNEIRVFIVKAILNCHYCKQETHDGECDRTLAQLQCATSGDVPTEEATNLTAYLRQLGPGSCNDCDLAEGLCSHKAVNVSWGNESACNGSEWNVTDFDALPCETSVLSSQLVEHANIGLALLTQWATEGNWTTTLKSKLFKTGIDNMTTSTEADTAMAVKQAKDVVCEGSHDILVVLAMCWYYDINFRSKESITDVATMIGAMVYNKANVVPTRLFEPDFDFEHGVLIPSKCHEKCDLVQFRMFQLFPDMGGQCCGRLGYLCRVDEGHCSVDQDCEDDLSCGGAMSCSWTSRLWCCVKPTPDSVAYSFAEASRKQVAVIGIDTFLGDLEEYQR